MPSVYTLPEDSTQAEEVVAKMILEGKSLRNPQQIRWWLANLYLQGHREFSNVNYNDGTVSVAYMDDAGALKFRFEKIVSQYQSQLGRLYSLDISPKVTRKGISLDGMRKSSVAQVVLDAALSDDKLRKLKLNLMPAVLQYGTVGAAIWYDGEDEQGVEIIPPWQLFPIPVGVSGPDDVRGIMRVRPVPLDWVKSLALTPGPKSKVYKGMDDVKVPSGHIPIDMETMGEGLVSMSSAGAGFFIRSDSTNNKGMARGKGKKKDEKNVPITQLVEVWIETSDGHLGEYAVFAGVSKLRELFRHNHATAKYPMPVQIIRDIPVGSFWGRAFVDIMMPLNQEAEIALSSTFQAVNDYDLYGVLLWPNSLGVPQEAVRGQDGIKKIAYEQDYTVPETRPFQIEPAKLSEPQVKASVLASNLMDELSNQPKEMMQGGAPGRVDSSAGLGFLYEVSGIPLSPTAKGIAEGMAGLYRSMLRILKDRWTDRKVVTITNLDDSLAGIILDADSGEMQLSQNAIPYPAEVSVTVASEIPVSLEQQKAELKEALRDQRITLDEFNFAVRKKGLDIPVGGEKEWQNYRRAMLENITLFGDGEVPGEVIVSERDDHRIHLMPLESFMARPEFFLASPQVRDAFVKHFEEHYYGLGNMPDQMPPMEDVAAATLGQQPTPQPPMMM